MSQSAESSPKSAGRLLLFDGMALVYRAHFAFMRAPRMTASGLNTSAVFGFLNTILELQTRFEPTHLAVAFDTPEPTARHLAYPAYKAQRDAMPEELSAALPWVFRLVEALRLPMLRLPGYEADDVIGTLAVQAEASGYETWMVTPDKDFAQLVAPHTRIFKPGRGSEPGQDLGVAEILANWEISRIDQVIDILGLMGDTSDNIPGIKGVTEKTAHKLVAQFDNLEGLLARTHELKGKLKDVVCANIPLARLSRELVTIKTTVPLPVTLADLKRQVPDREKLVALLVKLEFRTMAKRLLGADGETLMVQLSDKGQLYPTNSNLLSKMEDALSLSPSLHSQKKGKAKSSGMASRWAL